MTDPVPAPAPDRPDLTMDDAPFGYGNEEASAWLAGVEHGMARVEPELARYRDELAELRAALEAAEPKADPVKFPAPRYAYVRSVTILKAIVDERTTLREFLRECDEQHRSPASRSGRGKVPDTGWTQFAIGDLVRWCGDTGWFEGRITGETDEDNRMDNEQWDVEITGLGTFHANDPTQLGRVAHVRESRLMFLAPAGRGVGNTTPTDARTQIRDYLTGWLPARLTVPYDDTIAEISMALAVSLVDDVISGWRDDSSIRPPADAEEQIATAFFGWGKGPRHLAIAAKVMEILSGWGAVTNPTDGAGELAPGDRVEIARVEWSSATVVGTAPLRVQADDTGNVTTNPSRIRTAGPVVPAPTEDTGPRKQCSFWWDTKQCPDWAEAGYSMCPTHVRGRQALDTEPAVSEREWAQDDADREQADALRPAPTGCVRVDLVSEWNPGDKALWRIDADATGEPVEIVKVVGTTAFVASGDHRYTVDTSELSPAPLSTDTEA